MKMSFKIFTVSFLLLIIMLGVFGLIIISSNFNTELDMQIKNVIKENNFFSMIYYSVSLNDVGKPLDNEFLNNEDYSIYDKNYNSVNMANYILNEFKNISNNGEVFMGIENNLKFVDKEFLNSIDENAQVNRMINVSNHYYLQVVTNLEVNGESTYIEHLSDVSMIYEIRDKNYKFYVVFLIIGSLISSFLISFFSKYITNPLKKLGKSANLIASGNFKERSDNTLKGMKSVELVNLATHFNDMAKKIESYIIELQDYNKRQEDFISRFTHELKTPLTSIIGYADIIRTYDMDPKKKYELSNYIYKEGKRLEALSFHLLNLIILKKDKFDFVRVNSKIIFKEVKESIIFLLNKYGINIDYDIDESFILIEPVLFKSLLYNLIDNACKATLSDKRIFISGHVISCKYHIIVQDYGKGISPENISKVIEPFYMENKSRARKQGGAGLGLSLCNEIARIHNTKLKIESEINKGTKISFDIEVENYER